MCVYVAGLPDDGRTYLSGPYNHTCMLTFDLTHPWIHYSNRVLDVCLGNIEHSILYSITPRSNGFVVLLSFLRLIVLHTQCVCVYVYRAALIAPDRRRDMLRLLRMGRLRGQSPQGEGVWCDPGGGGAIKKRDISVRTF